MHILSIIILAVVEGVTEFLPISSTGHLILAEKILNITSTDFVKSFNIFIQLGAILAVIVLYFRRLFRDHRLLARLIIAFLPTAIAGLVLYKMVKDYLLGSSAVVLIAMLLGGIALIAIELWLERRWRLDKTLDQMTYKQAALIGLAQAVAIIPGVSRSAATILGGLLLGFKRSQIVEFSFLLAIPTMLAASGLDLVKSGARFSFGEWGTLFLGFVISFFVALFAVRWLLKFVRTHNFIPFGIYRIVVAIILFFFLF